MFPSSTQGVVVTGATGDIMRCPSCNHDNSVDASFCDACGAKLESICATCGTTNQPGARFCKKCGTRIAKESAPAKSAVASTAPKVRVTAEQAVADSGATTTALVLVGDVFADAPLPSRSHLYHPDYAHGFRRRSAPGSTTGRPARRSR